MAYTANQYNYCTPLSSVADFTDANVSVDDKKYFSLFDNTLDGSYFPVTGNVGFWGTSLSDSTGQLTEPFVINVTEEMDIKAISITGSQYAYPVEFTITFYNGSDIVYTAHVSDNKEPGCSVVLETEQHITSYTIEITKISAASSVAKLLKTFKSFFVRSYDTLSVSDIEDTALGSDVAITVSTVDSINITSTDTFVGLDNNVIASDTMAVRVDVLTAIENTIDKTYDVFNVSHEELSAITNVIDKTFDTLPLQLDEGISHVVVHAVAADTIDITFEEYTNLTNIHTVMKSPSRQVFGKVQVTYTDPMLSETAPVVSSSPAAYNSDIQQITDGHSVNNTLFFTLYDNDLSGRYVPVSDYTQTGWVSDSVSKADGTFDVPPYIEISFIPRPIASLDIYFDDTHGNIVEDFIVEFTNESGGKITKQFSGNTLTDVTVTDAALADIERAKVTILKVSKPYSPAVILELPIMSTFLYEGYHDNSKLVSLSMLEELTYEDDIEALGGVSANEVTVVFDNSNKDFNLNNPNSAIARQLKRNRKVVPWLGAEVVPGEIEWHKLGVYWSYEWDVPFNELIARVVAFDTIGLLDLSPFTNHQVCLNYSIGQLVDYVLNDAKVQMSFIDWSVDEELYNIVIPYAWFEPTSHAAALRRISKAYPMHIYCDRNGTIHAVPQKLRLDYYHDIWSDNTNVISKRFNSLYTVLPNVMHITVYNIQYSSRIRLISDNTAYVVDSSADITLNFGNPYVSDIEVMVDCDSTLKYTYSVYSWGIIFHFTGTGNIYLIECYGITLDASNTSMYVAQNEQSVRLNGAVKREVSADFIQTTSLAKLIADRLFSLTEHDKYDAEVEYRGDIALSINDSILLLDGIAPDNRYNIKRHQLNWDGGLTGTANLNS